jgi:hypothetical protein
MKLEANIVDSSVVAKMFGIFDEEELQKWGAEGYTTKAEVLGPLKRRFTLTKTFIGWTGFLICEFRSPKGKLGSVISGRLNVYPGDTLTICYTVTAYHGGDGGDGVRVRMPWGKVLTLKIYSMAG